MDFSLPPIEKAPVPLPHFPTRQQAFVFRALEFFSYEKIAKLLHTTPENIRLAGLQMGISKDEPGTVWLEKGYITIIKAMWHLLPYSQLLELLEMEAAEFAVVLREDDFLDIKLREKPDCQELYWRDLTEAELQATAPIKAVMDTLSLEGKKPFEFAFIRPDIQFEGEANFDSRIIYLFTGLYQKAFDVDSETYCPDALLESYQRLGINGIWTQAVLYMLTEYPFDPALSAGWEKRLANLVKLTQRCQRYGIKLYLYLNEPRSMEPAFFEKYPHLHGHAVNDTKHCLCTSTEEVQNYLKNAVETLCKNAPLLGGFFTITRSENPTNCYSHSTPETCTCPRCKDLSVGQVIGNVLQCIRDGADRVNPDIKVFAWSWSWGAYNEDIIRHLPQRTILISQSELAVPFEIGGCAGEVHDYSMSIPGPGQHAKDEWQLAAECGIGLAAKVQVNTTWEGSTVPALPVYPSVNAHLQRLQDCGVRHILLSWTLGGYPSENLQYAAKYFYKSVTFEAPNPTLQKACEQFCKAFREFPFHIGVLYNGPQNGGPANLLFAEPTGYRSTMTCFAYDDLRGWRADFYPEDVFESQFAKLCALWEEGLQMLEAEPDSETKLMAQAAHCLYKACLEQVRFYRARSAGDKAAMREAARIEAQTARTMLSLMNKNAAIGFEAANQYYFSKFSLCEKVLNCTYLAEHL